jgi:hypothetical protein
MIETGLRVHSACWVEAGAWTWCVANQIEQERGWAGWALDVELVGSRASPGEFGPVPAIGFSVSAPAPELLAPADEEAPAALGARPAARGCCSLKLDEESRGRIWRHDWPWRDWLSRSRAVFEWQDSSLRGFGALWQFHWSVVGRH